MTGIFLLALLFFALSFIAGVAWSQIIIRFTVGKRARRD